MKIVIGLAFAGILLALALAGRALLKDGRDGAPKSNRMVRALTLRIALSVALFVFILVSWKLGLIQPTGPPISK